MSNNPHVAELERKHRALDAKIAEEQRHPGASEFEIKRMKIEKLGLKEELQRQRQRSAA